MRGEVVRHVLGPSRHIQPQRNRMMLRHNQPALRRRFDLRIVRENPRSGHHHVALQPQDRLIHFVPRRQRNPSMILRARCPARQQILIVNKEAPIFEYRRWIGVAQSRRQFHPRAPLRLMIRPVIQRIDTEILLRELIDRVDRAAHVRPRQHNGLPLHRDRKRLSLGYIFRTHPLRQLPRLADQHRRPTPRGLLRDLRLRAEHLP